MPQSVYKVIELIGTSTTSWEEAARNAVERAVETLRELRVAEVVQQDPIREVLMRVLPRKSWLEMKSRSV